ncbi:hypothetical protein KMB89_gp21 [Citrobacter phage HCF1]|uniref:Uncharacterized protein n=1 Tax=Citrobacter phage HCF1 TaxID=2849700 RepID=A0ABX6D8N2_9CAUD|nr:hypothetical protein KMB89_gp21 [Citrobacter phage HCF1]
MFGLSEAQYNVVKQAARKCADEVREEIKRGGKYDQVATGIITKHHTPIATIITRLRFIWLVGYLEGRYGQQGEYE